MRLTIAGIAIAISASAWIGCSSDPDGDGSGNGSDIHTISVRIDATDASLNGSFSSNAARSDYRDGQLTITAETQAGKLEIFVYGAGSSTVYSVSSTRASGTGRFVFTPDGTTGPDLFNTPSSPLPQVAYGSLRISGVVSSSRYSGTFSGSLQNGRGQMLFLRNGSFEFDE